MRFPATIQRKTISKVPNYAAAVAVGGEPPEVKEFTIEIRFDAGTYTVVTLPVSEHDFTASHVGQRIVLEAA